MKFRFAWLLDLLSIAAVAALGKGCGSCPGAARTVDVVVLDVDLAQSTRTCVKELWSRLRPDGVLFSLDGQLRATHELLSDARFWREDVGSEPPLVEGLFESKLLTLVRK